MGEESFYAAVGMGLDTVLDYLHVGLTSVGMTDDAQDGIIAFNEKRTPR